MAKAKPKDLEKPVEETLDQRQGRREGDAEDGIEDLRNILRSEFNDAQSYVDDFLAPEREKAFDYYLGEVYTRGGEAEDQEDNIGQSSVVIREVADIIHMMLPGLARIFVSGENVVAFNAQGPDDEEAAKQRTDYINYLLQANGNSWFTTLFDVLHDGLLKKLGIFKWYWDERATVTEHSYTDVTAIQFQQLMTDPELDVLDVQLQENTPQQRVGSLKSPSGQAALDAVKEQMPLAQAPPEPPEGAPPPQAMPAQPPGAPSAPPAAGVPPPQMPPPGVPNPPLGGNLGGAAASPANPAAPPPWPEPLMDLTVRRTRRKPVLRVEAVPPEEFVLARDTRSIRTTRYCAHRTMPTVSDLVAEGFDYDAVLEHANADATAFGLGRGDNEAYRRNPALMDRRGKNTVPESQWRVFHIEHFVRYDGDGDGIAELHRTRTIGGNVEAILTDEVVSEPCFATWSPVRMPHSAVGMSIADQIGDLQDIKTQVVRSVLDSLAQSVFPPLAVVESAVNMDDVRNNEVGRIIRQQAPGMVSPLAEPFIGGQALEVLNYLDMVRAERTGITTASVGLNEKSLQSTTQGAVDNTILKSQERVEMIARTFAETGVRDLMLGILRSVTERQDVPQTVKLRGKWVEVDPASWDAECDVSVNVGLGRGTDQSQLQSLAMIAQKQEQIITQYGVGNPLVTPSQLRTTYAEMLRLAGFKHADEFFKEIGPAEDQAIAAQASQSTPPDPNLILAQIEGRKTDADIMIAKEKHRLDFLKAQSEDDRERDKTMMDVMLRASEIEAKYGTQVDLANIQAATARETSSLQAAVNAIFQDAQQQDAMGQQQAEQGLRQQQHMDKTALADRGAQLKHGLEQAKLALQERAMAQRAQTQQPQQPQQPQPQPPMGGLPNGAA